MNLIETFDTHIKAISTAEEWEQYKAMVNDMRNKDLNMKAVDIADEYDISEKMKIRLEMDIVKLAWEYSQSTLQELKEKVSELHYDAKNEYLGAESDYEMQQIYGKMNVIAEIRTLIDEAIND